jgi:hypothetical protein
MTSYEPHGIRGGVLGLAIALALFIARTAFYLVTLGFAVYAASDISWTFGGIFEFVGNALLLVAAFHCLCCYFGSGVPFHVVLSRSC